MREFTCENDVAAFVLESERRQDLIVVADRLSRLVWQDVRGEE